MRRFRATALATAIVALALPARSETPLPLPAAIQVLGSVTNAARPVGNGAKIHARRVTFIRLQGSVHPSFISDAGLRQPARRANPRPRATRRSERS